MRGGKALPPNFDVKITEEIGEEPHMQDPNATNFQGEHVQNILASLGFEEGELDMFFDMADGLVSEEQLMERYLEIARDEPFNQTWQNLNDAVDANYELNAIKSNGIPYTKHDIVNDTMDSFYGDITGGKRRKNRKQRKSKKQRKTKSKRRNRTRRVSRK